MDMESDKNTLEIQELFENKSPEQAWAIAAPIIRGIQPDYDFSHVRTAFDDAIRLFHGQYSGYCAIKTPYHDLNHTLDVFLCTVRLMHGVHLSGQTIGNETITLLCIAAIMHDIGYAQRQDEAHGTGAQHTAVHIDRGIAFTHHYLASHDFPEEWTEPLACLIRGTSPERLFHKIQFSSPHIRMAGKIIATADLLGQMADRAYLEKLLLLYLEFKEAELGNYQSMYELLCRTRDFYEYAQCKLNEDYDGIYNHLDLHFADHLGVARNFYTESIEKNLAYLSQVISRDESDYLAMLKRRGIVEKALILSQGRQAS